MLTYALTKGETEGTVVRTLAWEGQAIPQDIRERPELLPSLHVYWEAFAQLGTERGGMGGPIPWSAIMRYGKWLKMSVDQRDDLVYHVRRMDDVLLEHHEKERKRNSK